MSIGLSLPSLFGMIKPSGFFRGEWIPVDFFVTSSYHRNSLTDHQMHTWNVCLTVYLLAVGSSVAISCDFNHLRQQDALWLQQTLDRLL